MVAELRVDPAYAGAARLFDGHLGRAFHDEVAHAVVAVHKRGGGLFAHHADVRPHIEAAGLDAADVLRQPGDAVSVGPLQIGLRHQRGHGQRVGLRQAELRHRLRNEGFQPTKSDRHFGLRHRRSVFKEVRGCAAIGGRLAALKQRPQAANVGDGFDRKHRVDQPFRLLAPQNRRTWRRWSLCCRKEARCSTEVHP